MYSTREIEGMLSNELDNWLRWGRSRDWMPASYGSILGQLYRARLAEGVSPEDDVPPPPRIQANEAEAMRLERIIVSLPNQQKAAFVLHHLFKGAYCGWVVKIRTREDAARILGVGKTKYHQIVNSAHSSVWRKYTENN